MFETPFEVTECMKPFACDNHHLCSTADLLQHMTVEMLHSDLCLLPQIVGMEAHVFAQSLVRLFLGIFGIFFCLLAQLEIGFIGGVVFKHIFAWALPRMQSAGYRQ